MGDLCECPHCDGHGYEPLAGDETIDHTDFYERQFRPCVECGGTGEVTPSRLAAIEAHDAEWEHVIRYADTGCGCDACIAHRRIIKIEKKHGIF